MKRYYVAWLCLVVVAAFVNPSHAQEAALEKPSEQASLRAEQLFQEAARYFEQGKYEQAAQKLEQSHALEPALGTLLTLALCYEHLSRPYQAWTQYEEVLTYEAPERAELAAVEGIERTVSQLPRVRLQAAGRLPDGARLLHNGRALPRRYLSRPLALQAGEHHFAVRLQERTLWQRTLRVDERPAERTVAVELGSAADGPSAHRYAAWTAAGVATGALVLGTAFLIRSISKRNAADKHCAGGACRTLEGVELREQALSAGNVATAGYVIAAVGAAASGVLWLAFPATADESQEVNMQVGFGAASVQLRGRF